MLIFWRPIANNTIHIVDTKREQVFCGEYIKNATGWVATGDTPSFATCSKCEKRATEALFANEKSFTEVKIKTPAKRVTWSCSCGTITFAARHGEGGYCIAEHNKSTGRKCEKSRSIQYEDPTAQ